MSDPKAAPTEDQIRAAIDSGRTGDKLEWPDPSAAPLGTDAEAGGVPTPPDARRAEFAQRTGPSTPQSRQPNGMGGFAAYVIVGLVVLAVVALLAVFS